MATHSNMLAWRILWTEEPGGLQSMESQRVRHDWMTNTHTHTHTHTQHFYNRKKLYMHNANVIIDTLFVNFMCHTECTTKWSDISSNIFLGVFCEGVLDTINV